MLQSSNASDALPLATSDFVALAFLFVVLSVYSLYASSGSTCSGPLGGRLVANGLSTRCPRGKPTLSWMIASFASGRSSASCVQRMHVQKKEIFAGSHPLRSALPSLLRCCLSVRFLRLARFMLLVRSCSETLRWLPSLHVRVVRRTTVAGLGWFLHVLDLSADRLNRGEDLRCGHQEVACVQQPAEIQDCGGRRHEVSPTMESIKMTSLRSQKSLPAT